jgi:hypothetical protein
VVTVSSDDGWRRLLDEGFADTRSGKDLWQLLKPRVRVLMTMRRDWGDINDVYGHPESKYNEHQSLKWYLRDPDSMFSALWDILQVVFLVYVSLTVPLRAGFDIDVDIRDGFTFTWLFDTIVDLFFLVDVVLNFLTPYYEPNGVKGTRASMACAEQLKP